MIEFRIECEECEEVTHIIANDSPEFCPMCGRRAIAEANHQEISFIEEDE
jgi:rRNA maturation endonuclease Nob1